MCVGSSRSHVTRRASISISRSCTGGRTRCQPAPLADADPGRTADLLDRIGRAVPGLQTCSIGHTRWQPGEAVAACIARADVALYTAKADGRDRVVPGGLPGLQLAVGTDAGTAAVWDLETKDRVNSFRGASNYVNALAFTPDGRALAAGTEDHTVRLWDTATG